MSDIIENDLVGDNRPEYSVSEISGIVRGLIESEFEYVRIRGEIGRVSNPRSGHIYLDLKDERSVLAAVIWKGNVRNLPTMPEEGLEVIASGKLTTFGAQSKYQLIIEHVTPAGEGALMALLAKRKEKLRQEGLFDASRKKNLPYLPDVIGVITSSSGAVIRDILHRLRDRFPREVIIWPVAVQGDTCSEEVARAIDGFNSFTRSDQIKRPDLLIVARGGGSLEDLWGFNEENVLRAVAACEIPLISAIGHETDTTLIDLVSDVRAPTPTAAAEIAVPVLSEISHNLNKIENRKWRQLKQKLSHSKQRFVDVSRSMPRSTEICALPSQRLDVTSERLQRGLLNLIQRNKLQSAKVLAGFHPRFLKQFLEAQHERMVAHSGSLFVSFRRNSEKKYVQLHILSNNLRSYDLSRNIKAIKLNFYQIVNRLLSLKSNLVASNLTKLESLDRLRETLGYKETLNRGYSVVRAGGSIMTSVSAVVDKAQLEVEFRDGRIEVCITETAANEKKQVTKAKGKTKIKGKVPTQGSLF
jgi:exodeoxyribonuclease VII large subunit